MTFDLDDIRRIVKKELDSHDYFDSPDKIPSRYESILDKLTSDAMKVCKGCETYSDITRSIVLDMFKRRKEIRRMCTIESNEGGQTR